MYVTRRGKSNWTSSPRRYHSSTRCTANECRISRARDKRHCFGTHAALFGVNPWRLQGWMGHKRIEETMLYVHVADVHARELPAEIRDAAIGEADPDARIVRMLGARGTSVPRNEGVAAETRVVTAA
jgi:hypothetical protein